MLLKILADTAISRNLGFVVDFVKGVLAHDSEPEAFTMFVESDSKLVKNSMRGFRVLVLHRQGPAA